ncbi:oxidoreductase [Sphingomonas sp.]|uniref:oxidoreductase n=1 Tax=Sphingomonas sp. TaxID=28214 RepID=UPI0025FF6FEA|nr:oxidoreductase [Sphingomonas sp.]
MRTWFITGASRGFGALIAKAALEAGDAVVATARNPDDVTKTLGGHDHLLAVRLDVTDQAQANDAVAAAIKRFGRIDILVNNAGFGVVGAVEEASAEEIQRVYATNVFGLLGVTRAVLPHMRRQRSGRVFNLSSVGGYASRAGFGIYCSTKFAVEALSEALHGELEPLGIHVTVVEPGAFRTDFLDGSSLAPHAQRIADYDQTSGQTREWSSANNYAQQGDPAKLATAIVRLAGEAQPPLRIQFGSDTVAIVEAKNAFVASELAQWRDLALSTDYPAEELAGA